MHTYKYELTDRKRCQIKTALLRHANELRQLASGLSKEEDSDRLREQGNELSRLAEEFKE